MLTTLLTDDEVVCAAIATQISWPYPLPTVPVEPSEFIKAGNRGARSLLVRELASTPKGRFSVDDGVLAVVSRVGKADRSIIAYVGAASDPATLLGTAIYLYRTLVEGENTVMDFMTADGIHDLRESTQAESDPAFLAAIESAFRNGIESDPANPDRPALFVKPSDGAEIIQVVQGGVTFGTIAQNGDGSEFSPTRRLLAWDASEIAAALGLELLAQASY